MWLAVLFIFFGVFSRLVPHLPNFSPLAAVALFSGVYLNRKHGYLLPLGIFILSDFIIGFHNTVFFTWSSIVLIYFIGSYLSTRKSAVNFFIYTLGSALVFFIITNFGVWLMGWYPRTMAGLGECFINALPFFRASLISNLLFVAVFFSIYEFSLARQRLIQKSA
ncbi:MAG: hypothetical protein JW867_03000 [Candidatus Omnitrophica bacterium]|nr:hypothetical protein [Candidatus Omnitrophota bacterium]